MSRSYRKPFTSVVVCNNRSNRSDKKIATRIVRRAMNRYLRMTKDYDSFLMPHMYECRHNDVWGWDSDGYPFYVSSYYFQAPEVFIEIDELTQVERVLDGEPAINPSNYRPHWSEEKQKEWRRKVQRK
jgi:hypothetical protein